MQCTSPLDCVQQSALFPAHHPLRGLAIEVLEQRRSRQGSLSSDSSEEGEEGSEAPADVTGASENPFVSDLRLPVAYTLHAVEHCRCRLGTDGVCAQGRERLQHAHVVSALSHATRGSSSSRPVV